MPVRSMWRRNSCPRPAPSLGPFDQSGNVGHDEGAVGVDLHAAQVGVLGGEGIGGDFRPGARQPAEHGALAGVGFSHQADVGDHFQFQPHQPRLARLAGGELSRRPIGGRLEADVALAAFAALGDHQLLAASGQVAQHKALLGVDHDRARRDRYHKVCGRGPVAVVAAAVAPGGRLPLLAMRQGVQAIDAFAGDQDDAAAVAAVAAVGAAARNELLPVEGDAAVAPFASLETDFHFIDEHS